ncbi:MAG: hypothetical protein JNK93_14135, partial [Planctomycetia bacterium]|nr:hypothetical protein [Planctomycetia bacterium]
QKKAYFHNHYNKMETTKQGELEGDQRLNEDLLRHMTIPVDPKWADTVLEAARNDGNRFAIKGMQDDSAALGEGIISNDPLARGEVPDLAATGAPAPRPRPRRAAGDDKPE